MPTIEPPSGHWSLNLIDELDRRMPPLYARLIRAAIEARAAGTVAYLENGFPVPAAD